MSNFLPADALELELELDPDDDPPPLSSPPHAATASAAQASTTPRTPARPWRHEWGVNRMRETPPPLGCDPSSPVLGAASKLVEIDGADEHGAHGNLLPERLHADDHEAVLQDRGDEDAEDRAEHRSDAAEQARAADHDGGDRLQVVGVVAADGRRREARDRQEAGEAGQRAGERVDLDEVAVDRDAGA